MWTGISRLAVSFWILNNISHVHPCAGYSCMMHRFTAQNCGRLVLAMVLHEAHAAWIKAYQIKKNYQMMLYTMHHFSKKHLGFWNFLFGDHLGPKETLWDFPLQGKNS